MFYTNNILTVLLLIRVCVFSGGQETELISSSGATHYRRPKQQTAESELINSESSSV